MLKRLLSVGGFTLLSRGAGFARDVIMAAVLGDSYLSDAFFVAWRLPNSFRNIFAEGAFNAAFIPRYARTRVSEGEEKAARFADEVFSWQMVFQILLLVVAMAGMPAIVGVIAPGFAAHPGQSALSVSLSRVTFPYLALTVVAVQLSAMLNARHKFAAAAAWPILLNLSMIATLAAARRFPNAAYAAAWGVLLGGLVQLFFILPAAWRGGLALRFVRLRWTPAIRNFLVKLGTATFGSASVQIGLFIDTLIASFLPAGVLTAINYADRIDQLPLGVLGIALYTVLLPEMSTKLAAGDEAGAHVAQNHTAALGLFLTLPFAASFLIVPQAIMRGVFVHGAFSVHAADISALALAGYGVGLPAFVLVRVLTATFYARHDTATPVRATWLAVAMNIGFKFLLVWGFHLGAVGVALGTSLGSWANVSFLFWLSRRRGLLVIDETFRRALLPSFLGAAATAGCALAGVACAFWLVPAASVWQREAALALAIVFAGAGYGFVAFLFRRRLRFSWLAKG